MGRIIEKIWVLVFLVGCQGVVDSNTLVGIYIAHYPHGTGQLVLNTDGTYQQLFSLTGQSLQVINSGQWELRDVEGRKLVLRNAVFVDNGFGEPAKTKRSGDWLLEIRTTLRGTLRFPVNEDRGIEFRKIN